MKGKKKVETSLTKDNTNKTPALWTQSDMQETVLASDVVIPRVLLMQGLSEFVTDRKAQMGDIVRSTTAEKLGGPESPVEFIPLTYKNFWVNFEIMGGTPEYRSKEVRNASNEHLEWDYEKDKVPWKRMKLIEVYALLVQDLKAEEENLKAFKETGVLPDLEKTLLPVALTFRSTSYNAGKSLVTHFTKASTFGVKPFAYSLQLSCDSTKNDKGSFYVYKVGNAKPLTHQYLEVADRWYKTVTSRPDLKVDDSDEQGEGRAVAPNSQF